MSATNPDWAEYLAAAAGHLEATRGALECGAPTPMAPRRPSGPMPEEFEQLATNLSAGYAQLSLELSVARHDVAKRLAATRRTVVAGTPSPRYVDAPL